VGEKEEEMIRPFSRSLPAIMAVLALCGAVGIADPGPSVNGTSAQTASSTGAAPSAKQELKVSRTTSGETVALGSGSYERVLLAPPDEAGMTAGASWEIPMDLAIELSQKPPAERWLIIRRNLLLPPDDGRDIILWREAVDAILDQIKQISPVKQPKRPDFGLRVAFPKKKGTSGEDAEVVLTFNRGKAKGQDIEARMDHSIAERLTGVEVFVRFGVIAGDEWVFYPESIEPDDLQMNPWKVPQEILELKLYDSAGAEVKDPEAKGDYFLFSSLQADAKFGSDYTLKVFNKAEPGRPVYEGFAPVRKGLRTRLTLVLSPAIAGRGGLEGAPHAAQDLYDTFVGSSYILSTLTPWLVPNPGLHVGFIMIEGEGPEIFWSTRFRLLPTTVDRGPRYVDRGKITLQRLTHADDPRRAADLPVHFVKLVWRGSLDEGELLLESRPEAKFLGIRREFLGIGLGVVPSVTPSLAAVGASLKPIKGLEVFLGAGKREGYETSFVYGLTLDVEDLAKSLGFAK
jgi:hypothetical protein